MRLVLVLFFTGFLFSNSSLAQKPLYGFTAFPNDLSLEALAKTHELVIENSSLYAVHRDDGCIPWQEALSGEAFPEWLTNDWVDTRAQIPADIPISLHITPTHCILHQQKNDRIAMAEQCGAAEGEAGEMPEVLRGKPYNDPQIMTAYLNYARQFADIFEPTFFTIAIEMGDLARVHPEVWTSFAELINGTLEGLRESHPNIKLGVEFVLQTLMMPQVAKQVKPLTEQLDFLGISFYPYGSEFGEFYGVPALPEPPAQWLEPLRWLREYTDKPVAIIETGYTTKNRNVNGINFPGNEALQAAFLKDLIASAQADEYLFVVWFVPIDYEKLLEKLPDSDNKTAAYIWVNAGLLDSNLNPKPAWSIWQSLFK
jgi:hypothetical protein